ncbi:hypothetical protein PVA45_05935 [Entomospira entomophila]|uniref:Lipoprotein n=1 Tax=Entomospira entomophila TaxID=2719988 RepID=A0A968KRS0_9SPIO|nr:hypothetical protein [Entomospira entomophilus]NIZ41038.1 hypothetical protein [Entomospira entomophilus]WDI35249.1 hypothetical protein PVA45_05935 [Entomospira entomophilus]
MRKIILILIVLVVISCKYDEDQGNVALEEIFEELDTSLFSIENVVFQFMNTEYVEYGFFSFDLIYNGKGNVYFYNVKQVVYENNTLYYGLVDWQEYMKDLWAMFFRYKNTVTFSFLNHFLAAGKTTGKNYSIMFFIDPEDMRRVDLGDSILLDYNEIMRMNEIVVVFHFLTENQKSKFTFTKENYVVTTAENPGQRIELRSTDIQIIDKRIGAFKQNS